MFFCERSVCQRAAAYGPGAARCGGAAETLISCQGRTFVPAY